MVYISYSIQAAFTHTSHAYYPPIPQQVSEQRGACSPKTAANLALIFLTAKQFRISLLQEHPRKLSRGLKSTVSSQKSSIPIAYRKIIPIFTRLNDSNNLHSITH